ncbi:MAG TPA: serine/threonine-protein kinase [Polyangiaceae bacterium]
MADLVVAHTERAQRRVGTSLRRGKYRLDRLLGIGGTSAVFAATHRNGKRFAVKLLHPELSSVDDLRERFLRDGYAANRVQHPSVVPVLDDDVDEDDGSAFIAMELLEGTTVAAEWHEAARTLSLPRVVTIADAVLGILVAVHESGIVHRDVRPGNVFVTADGMKLLDVGLGRLGDPARTMTAHALDPSQFVAPELAGEKTSEIDPRTDLYSVGAMIFTLLTGHAVHRASTPTDTLRLAATRHARSLREVWAGAPPPMVTFVDVALAFDREKRWASAVEMRTALGHALALSASRGAPGPVNPVLGPTGTVVVGRRSKKRT